MENIILSNNGLTLYLIKSEATPISFFDNFRENLSEFIKTKSLVVAYLDYKVLIGTYINRNFHFYDGETFDDKFIQKIRIFNEHEEFYAWRNNGRLKGRFRIDTDGTDVEVVDAYQALFGTDSIPSDKYSKLWEKRGTEIIIPFQNLIIDEKKKRLFIKTKNYVKSNDLHQATYFDCRFVGFSVDQKNLLPIEE